MVITHIPNITVVYDCYLTEQTSKIDVALGMSLSSDNIQNNDFNNKEFSNQP